ncbi:NAD/FAD-binding protein [Acidisoma sp. 7E03]
MVSEGSGQRRIAVIGAGIAGLSAAWLLAQRHDVTLYEKEPRLGGHSHTVEAEGIPVDTGFIVYNEPAYPNLTALFHHLDVPTHPSDMSFSVSLDGGALEYAGSDLAGLFAQKRNLVNFRFYAMLRDLLRFYREAPAAARGTEMPLRDLLRAGRYGRAFIEDHLYPMIAAVWSCPTAQAGDLPAAAFIRFCENHGLLKIAGRPVWRTVQGGSREYVRRLRAAFAGTVRIACGAVRVQRQAAGVLVRDAGRDSALFDDVVLACHADTALQLLADPREDERRTLGAFRYTCNEAWLHRDRAFMPSRRAAWASWNYLGRRGGGGDVSVTYWMNRLQPLATERDLFVTLNPDRPPRDALLHQSYEHPVFDVAALRAQQALWSLQGADRLWFCGAYFGAGFHEDGLQAGLAVAEALGGVRRPWQVASESGRIHLPAQGRQAA